MAMLETFAYPIKFDDADTKRNGYYAGTIALGTKVELMVYHFDDDFYVYDRDGSVAFRFMVNTSREMKHLVFVTQSGDTRRYHLLPETGKPYSLLAIQSGFQEFMGPKATVRFMLNCRFKINVRERALLMNGRVVATGTMDDGKENWQGNFPGRTWQRQLGEDFIHFMAQQFDLNWAHKVVCQRRGHYQYLPNVALFFDNTESLVLKLVNRPNDKDSCEGFYVGSIMGKGFGYHIDGDANKIPLIDQYMRSSLEDIIGRPLSDTEFQSDRFITDVEYRESEGHWVLTSSVGDIARMVKEVTPENTCAVRKHVSWDYTVFGQAIPSIPLLENLLINAFYRGYSRLAKQLGL